MHVFVTGATGFTGRALVSRLIRDGHRVSVWVRSPERARTLLGGEIAICPTSAGAGALRQHLQTCDAVVNLAGEPILSGRWSEARRRVLRESRIELTQQLVRAMSEASPQPAVLISSSASGYYGNRGDELLAETAAAGSGFLAHLCEQWEEAARQAERAGIRVVILRTGVVLGPGGGVLAKMLPAFRCGVGGPIGSGRQYMPWIHLHDFVRVITTALADDRYRGAINMVAPQAVTSREFARALGRVLHRPALLPLPAFLLRWVFGDAAQVLLDSQRAEPSCLCELGFAYQYPTLEPALAAAVHK